MWSVPQGSVLLVPYLLCWFNSFDVFRCPARSCTPSRYPRWVFRTIFFYNLYLALYRCSASAAQGQAAADQILNSAFDHSACASQYCLNQTENCNAGLQAAAASNIKNKLQLLKKQTKSDMITIDAQLWYYPRGGGAAKKVKDVDPKATWTDTCYYVL